MYINYESYLVYVLHYRTYSNIYTRLIHTRETKHVSCVLPAIFSTSPRHLPKEQLFPELILWAWQRAGCQWTPHGAKQRFHGKTASEK